jgi:hypothetical protein
MQVTTLNTAIRLGLDDGTFNWNTPNSASAVGYKGFSVSVDPFGDGGRIGLGTSTIVGPSCAPWQVNDICRIDYTPGTFTGDVPDNNGTATVERIRAGVKTLQATYTGLPSMTQVKAHFGGRSSSVGVLKFDGLTPAIAAGSQEYQDAT